MAGTCRHAHRPGLAQCSGHLGDALNSCHVKAVPSCNVANIEPSVFRPHPQRLVLDSSGVRSIVWSRQILINIMRVRSIDTTSTRLICSRVACPGHSFVDRTALTNPSFASPRSFTRVPNIVNGSGKGNRNIGIGCSLSPQSGS